LILEQLRQRPQQKPSPASRPNLLSSVPPNEKLLLTCFLLDEDARAAIKHYLQNASILPLLELRHIFEAALQLDAEGLPFSIDAVARRLEPRLQRTLADLSFADFGVSQDAAAQQAIHCLQALEAKAAEAARNDLKRQIKQLEAEGKFDEAMRVMQKLASAGR